MSPLPAVILAAGKGTRLGKLSDNQPKPMTEVNGTPMFSNLMESLVQSGIEKIVIVTGYMNTVLEEAARAFDSRTEIVTVYNEIYATTNNIYSLWLAKKYLQDGFFLFEADIFFENEILKNLIQSPQDNVMLIGKHNDRMDGTVVDLDASDQVQQMYLKRHQQDDFDYSDKYKTVNFYKIGPAFAREFFIRKMDEHIENEDWNSYYELIIKEALDRGYPFYGLKTGNLKWWEIDTPEDLNICEDMFKA
ncbi:phosphocholine cytidylyltransferase family protein [bacterium]|nr:phosphocholine cytidylyltransferase family protein [bacterium]